MLGSSLGDAKQRRIVMSDSVPRDTIVILAIMLIVVLVDRAHNRRRPKR